MANGGFAIFVDTDVIVAQLRTKTTTRRSPIGTANETRIQPRPSTVPRSADDKNLDTAGYPPAQTYRSGSVPVPRSMKRANMPAQRDNVIPLNPSGPTRVGEKFNNGQTGEAISPLDRLQLTQYLNRKWRRHLSPYEFIVMSYIIDRSVGWGYPTFKASHQNILEGNKDYSGIGLTRPTYMRTLQTLSEKGAIIRKRHKEFVTLGPNFNWKPEADHMALPIPKRKKTEDQGEKSQNDTSRSLRGRPQKSHSETQKKGITEERNYTSRSGVEFDPEAKNNLSGEEASECNELQKGQAATAAIRTRFQKKKADDQAKQESTLDRITAKTKVNATDIEQVWVAAMRETFPTATHVSWGIKQKGMVNRTLKKYIHRDTVSFAELTDWAIRNWTTILRRRLSFMTNPPAVPSLNWFISEGVLRLFAECYDSGELNKLVNSDDANELTRLMATGMSEADALVRIGESRARQGMRQENQAALAKIKQREAVAKQRESRAERLEGMGGVVDKARELGVPVSKPTGGVWGNSIIPHPNSPAMKKAAQEQRDADVVPINPKAPAGETWEEMQERLRKARADKLKGTGQTDGN